MAGRGAREAALSVPPAVARRPVALVRSARPPGGAASEEQLATALRQLGWDARAVAPRDLAGLGGALVLFDEPPDLLRRLLARRRGQAVLLDGRARWAETGRRPAVWNVAGALFANRAQQAELDRPSWTSAVLSAAASPDLRPHAVPPGELRALVLGSRECRTMLAEMPGLCYAEGDPAGIAGQFNCHVALSRSAAEARYRSNLPVAVAAACGALLVTTRDVSAVESLGEDYPYYCDPNPRSVAATLERARRELGTAARRGAHDRLQAARRSTMLDAVAGALAAHLERVVAARGAR